MKSFAELYKELDQYPKIETLFAYHNSSGEIMIETKEFRVESTSRLTAENELVKDIINQIGDGSKFHVWVRIMPQVWEKEESEMYVAYARIAFYPKSL